jgi:hypothetical protein
MSKALRLNLYAPDGRTMLAKDVTKTQAERWVRKNIGIHPKMTMEVFQTDPMINEINGTRHGWRHSIFYSYGKVS